MLAQRGISILGSIPLKTVLAERGITLITFGRIGAGYEHTLYWTASTLPYFALEYCKAVTAWDHSETSTRSSLATTNKSN